MNKQNKTTVTFDPTKPVQTRDGREAGIYETNCGGNYMIHGYVVNDGVRNIESWDGNGVWDKARATEHDLVNIPDYPPLPEVEGGRLEYRGMRWSNRGKHCVFYFYLPNIEKWMRGFGDPRGGSNCHYAEFIPDEPKLIPYTLETFPMWAVWVRKKHNFFKYSILSVRTLGVQLAEYSHITKHHELLTDYEIASTDGIWHPAGQEVSK